MQINGNSLIGGKTILGQDGAFNAIDPSTGNVLTPSFGGCTLEDLNHACELAEEAFDVFRESSPETRAVFLETIADNISALGDTLVERCVAETGLPRARIEAERTRTTNQLRMFAALVRSGDHIEARIDPALPERKPAARPDLRLRNIPVGPVAVFGASNFPLAFSVAGGDTASAFAAGCPVVVKAHSAHPGTAELVGTAIQRAVIQCSLPEGTFSLLFATSRTIGEALVSDHRIKAVGFTGSRAGGTALMAQAAARAVPIPVYAEMSSTNPVLLFPHALANRPEEIATQFVDALVLGAGQFCTNPGLLLAVEGSALDRFLATVRIRLSKKAAATMLSPGIHQAYCAGISEFACHPSVTVEALGEEGGFGQGQAVLFSTRADDFRADPRLHQEIFGAASLLVRCPDWKTLVDVVQQLEGQLTISMHIDEGDYADARMLLPLLERTAGRLVANGFGTGVEVGHAMTHGGPYPATTDGRSTSVGSMAVFRFLRPVSYQDMPDALLPAPLKHANPWSLLRRMDGKLFPAADDDVRKGHNV